MKQLIRILIIITIVGVNAQNKKPKELGIGFAISSNPYKYENMSHPEDIFYDESLTSKIKTKQIFPYFYKPD